MAKTAWDMRAILGVVPVLVLSAAPWPAAAIITPLQAPKTSASYHLALKDPPVNVILLGWYCRDNDLLSEIEDIYVRVDEGIHLDLQEGVMRAVDIEEKLKKMKAPGWPMTEPSMHGSPLKKGLDAPPGGRKVYKFQYCATKAELLTVRKTVMTYLTSVWKGTLIEGVQDKKFWEWDNKGFPFSHTITVTVSRKAVRDRRMTFKPVWQPKERSAAGRKRTTVPRGTKSARTVPRSERKSASGCHFSKPRIRGQGKPGFAGFPRDFPRPPGLETGWTLATAKGTLYVLGISGGRQSTVRFVKKALPARGWRIIRTKTTRSPGAKADSVHIFFRNRDYCGWVTIGTGAPMPTSMNVFLKKRRSQGRGG